MDTTTVLYIVGLLLRISVAVPAHSWDESDLSMASVVVKEGESAEISCTMKESNVAYSWLKGGSLENSTVVASFISGITVNDPDDPFTVTENGTLIIKKVSRNDEGNYICRVSSEEISCHGDVFVLVQAVLQDFQLTIEYCKPENSCVISTESTKPTSLTCKATNASPSMKLKWFNGSHEIKDNIQENSLTNGQSREISSTIRDVYKAPSTLTCQAVDFKTSNDDGMFAHVQFRTHASTAAISPGWIVTTILFIAGFVILFLIVIFITVWPKIRNGKDVETQNSAEQDSLLTSNNERLEADLKTKDDEIKNKNDEVNKLKKALETVRGQSLLTNDEHQADLETKDAEIKNKNDGINKIKADLKTKDDEIKNKNDEITKMKKALETVRGQSLQTIDEHQADLKTKDAEIKNKNDEITKMKKREQEISFKERRSNEREDKIKSREDDMNSKEQTLKERETNIKKQLLDLERERREFRLDRMVSKDPIRINCKLITSMTGDDARVGTKEKGGQAKVKAGKGIFSTKDAKFHTVYPTNTKPIDLCHSIDDLVENAIDGGYSCLIAHDVSRRDHWMTMFGPGEGASDALVPYAITKIFKRSKELKTLDYKVAVQAGFMVQAPTSAPPTLSESVKIFDIPHEQKANELLKTGNGKIVLADGAMDHFVQFYIKTKTIQETLSGVLVLGTFRSIQMIKECFRSVIPSTLLTQNISAITSDGRCRSVLITHIHEEKEDETKNCLAMVNEMVKKNKK